MGKSNLKVINQNHGNGWFVWNGDSTQVLKGIPDNSVHYILFSPPFINLYVYSNSERDVGNSRSDEEFWEHYQFILKELYRVLMPGRLLTQHVMNVPALKEKDGFIGIKDFRGDVIRACQNTGFYFHSEVVVFKDAVTQMQRTKALGLLHKQIKKDSCMSRMAIPDTIVTFRKPGENPERVTHTNESYPVSKWQVIAQPIWEEYPSPVWWDINQSDTLNGKLAREDQDERHVAPLQLPVIERCVELWTNPNDIVLDPFSGIGSTGYQSILMGRRYIGIELKESYYNLSVKNLQAAEAQKELQPTSLFDDEAAGSKSD